VGSFGPDGNELKPATTAEICHLALTLSKQTPKKKYGQFKEILTLDNNWSTGSLGNWCLQRHGK
jgi:hypothetical protein